jgi:hypothetical protein
MRWRDVAVLYAIAGLLAVDWMRAPRPTDQDAMVAPPRARIVPLDAASVNEVAIEHGERRVVARRSGDEWRVEEPAGADVPSDLVRAFVAAVLEAEEIEKVGPEADAAAFGLGDGATRVELRPAGGPPETLWLGGANPSGTAVYARRLGGDGVVLVGRTLRLYEEMILQALPRPNVPADTGRGRVGARAPLTRPRTAV